MESDILEKALEIKGFVTEMRRQIHQHPELGFEEFETTALVRRELERMGVEVAHLAAETGVMGIIKGEKDGSGMVTALRADMDALPVVEQTGLPYASQNKGVMHACGHDGHTATHVGVAKLLSSMRDRFSGTVKLLFQPAEEALGGAKSMVEAGVLENPVVDTVVALHGWPGVETGRIVVAFQDIVSREIDALDHVVISVCSLNGGKAFNVIPEETTFTGTVRCQKESVRESIAGRMDRIMSGISTTFGCSYELDYVDGVPPLINDPGTIDLVVEAAKVALGEGHVVQLDRPAMSSEDFSIMINHVNHGAFFRLGLTDPGDDPKVLHNDHFDFNDEALPTGIAVLTQFVLLKNH
jgi:metal-dependent amidase/aminoacylase/carboxypeptidase family protein